MSKSPPRLKRLKKKMTLKEAEKRLKDAGIDSYVWDARELYLFATGVNRHAPIDKPSDIDSPR